jgi:hypothetical protein
MEKIIGTPNHPIKTKFSHNALYLKSKKKVKHLFEGCPMDFAGSIQNHKKCLEHQNNQS